jgi:hypothetical protein
VSHALTTSAAGSVETGMTRLLPRFTTNIGI